MAWQLDTLSLYSAHRADLVQYAGRIVGDRSAAEDVVQEAFIRFDRVSQSQTLIEPLAYLYKIVRNLALDVKRRSQRETIRQEETPGRSLETFAAQQPSPEAEAGGRQELEQLQSALLELPERSRIALEMHWFGNYTIREIARFLELSVGTTHALVADGLEHCRDRLRRPRN